MDGVPPINWESVAGCVNNLFIWDFSEFNYGSISSCRFLFCSVNAVVLAVLHFFKFRRASLVCLSNIRSTQFKLSLFSSSLMPKEYTYIFSHPKYPIIGSRNFLWIYIPLKIDTSLLAIFYFVPHLSG